MAHMAQFRALKASVIVLGLQSIMCFKDVERPRSLRASVLTGFISESDTSLTLLTSYMILVRPA